eukprot:CAMPEP_0184394280 /NCGR_PEP_ID=MMETSP0007-20130409/39667_1 /TAXON_ID=97485 /ORGANISM="Prymnesium parvum, Strain Texoma1" /LENGTH=71 /DNA_ID=CAMNT_0026745795 /DNA_START=1 /DNA_END=214 /DNA_ORIENTATION=-
MSTTCDSVCTTSQAQAHTQFTVGVRWTQADAPIHVLVHENLVHVYVSRITMNAAGLPLHMQDIDSHAFCDA